MEIINPSKAAVSRKRGTAQQGAGPMSQHTVEPLRLERVFGSGSCAAAAIACPHPVVPGLMAYSSGAVVVLYDSMCKQQTAFFSPKPRRSLSTGKPYACLAFSRDGAYLAAGERSGQSPEILVWEVISGRCLQALRGHKHGVGSIAFSQDGRLLVSTGESYDGQLCVWDWQTGVLVAKQHTQAEVQRACFAEELAAGAGGFTITTVGKAGHFKVWSLSLPAGRNRDGHLAAGQASLTPRPANLKEFRGSSFVGVAAAPADGPTPQAQALLYALTQNGVLLTLRPATRTIDKSLSLQVNVAFALAVSPTLIACACAAGVVRLFATRTLAFKGNLPRPSAARGAAGCPVEPNGAGPEPAAAAPEPLSTSTTAGSIFPDAVGCAFDCSGERLTVMYADRSLMVWDVRNPSKVARVRSVLSHAGVVWSAALIPPWQAPLLGPLAAAPVPGGKKGESLFGPSAVLCTCGADGTVRLWNVCLNNSASTAGPFGVPADAASAARVTRTLRAIIYASQPAGPDTVGAGQGAASRRCTPDAPLPAPGGAAAAAAAAAAAGQAPKPVALRCLRVSPCGRHLATGDARGNLRVFSLATLELLMLKEAHDAEILSLDYSTPSLDGACYLASGSRDMLVHVYDMSRGYELVGTCDAHLGAVTAVRFSAYGGRLALLSCSADKSVVFRLVQLGPCGLSFEIYHTERMSRGVLYDMAVDPTGGRAVAVGQDNQMRLFDVATGRAIRNFSGDATCGEAVAVVMDATGHLAVCSCADGSVAIYDVDTGTLLARGSGHSDVCTGAVLLEDHRGLVTVGGDGCALLWRLTPRLAQRMQDAAAECRRQLEQQAALQLTMVQKKDATPAVSRRKAWDLAGAASGPAAAPDSSDDDGDIEPQQVHVDMSATMLRVRAGKPLLSVEKLPKWAQLAHVMEGDEPLEGAPCNGEFIGSAVPGTAPAPAGKWAQRVLKPPMEVAAKLELELELPFAGAATTASVAARAGALAGQPRTWAEVVEEDDEIVFCDSLEDCQLLPGDPLDAAPEADGALNTEAAAARAAAGTSPRGTTSAGVAGSGAKGDSGANAVEAVDEQGRPCSPAQAHPTQEAEEDPASGCASNHVGGTVAEAAAVEGDGIRRDLFREHFDSLGLDQASATKAPPPDPRRLSFTLMYRQARASGAGANPDLMPASPTAAGKDAGEPFAGTPVVAVAGATTPYLARIPLPPAINTARGSALPAIEPDGAITSAIWTPERAMLPLTSPALANTDKQLLELERIRLRLMSTLRKRQTNDDTSLGGSRPGNAAAPPAAAAATGAALSAAAAAVAPPVPSGAAAAGPEDKQQQQLKPVVAAAAVDEPVTGAAVPAAVEEAPAAPTAAAPGVEAGAQPQEQTTSCGGTFLLPPPPAYTPAAPHQRASPGAAAAPSGSTETGSMPSPGFSSLSAGTSRLGHSTATATPAVAPRQDSRIAGEAGGESARLFVFNPIYGATPGTPVLGLAGGRPQGAGPQGEQAPSAAADAPPVASRANTDEVIRAVLEPQCGGMQGDNGVCVVTKDGLTDGKVQQQTATAGQPAAAPGQQQQWRPKTALPAMRPKAAGSPAKSQTSAGAAAAPARSAGPQAGPGGPVAVMMEPPTAAAAPAVPAGDVTSDATADVVARMQVALADFAGEFRRVHSSGTPTGPDSGAQRYRDTARSMAVQLTELLAGYEAASVRAAGPARLDNAAYADVPPAVMCPSPQMSVDLQEGRQQGSRLGWGRSAAHPLASMSSSHEVSSSQVVVEMGLVESMVEEKLHQRMKEEMKRVEETVMQRIMQTMMLQQQQQQQ